MLSMEKSTIRDDSKEENLMRPVHHRIPNSVAAFLPAHKVIIRNSSIHFKPNSILFQQVLGIPCVQ